MKRKDGNLSRIVIIVSLLSAIFLVFIIRLMQLQLIDGEGYRKVGNVRYTREVVVKAARGEIVDRNGIPLAANRTGYNVIFDKSYMEMEDLNDIILLSSEITSKNGETFNESIPITKQEPYVFENEQTSAVSALKKRLSLQEYATFNNVWDALCERYEVDLKKYTNSQIRTIVAVRYEMEIKGFTVSTPYTFARDVSMATVSKILEKSITHPGVSISEESIREYPNGTIAPHIIGTIGPIYADEYKVLKDKGYKLTDYVGKTGIEKKYESQLKGKDGIKVIEFDNNGKVISTSIKTEPIPGNTIVLTLDSELQLTAQKALEERIIEVANTSAAKKGKEADSGAVVAINSTNGDILVAATYPSYDLSTYSKDYSELVNNEVKPLFNRAINGAYAPGSTFKPFMSVAGILNGTVNKHTTINCDRIYEYLGMNFTCMGFHGNLNVANALRVSCNCYFYDLGRQLGIDKINEYAYYFGLGQETGLELSENIGRLASPEYRKSLGREWYPGDTLQASIGQSDSMFSPLQIAVYNGVIGNNGVRMQSHIVDRIVSYNYEDVIYEYEDKVLSTLDDNLGAFESVKEGMYLVSTKGTGRSAFGNYPIRVGSKTGSPENYGNKAANAVFTAIGPLENCELSVTAVIEEGFNGNKAAPIVKKVFDKYFFDGSESNYPALENEILS